MTAVIHELKVSPPYFDAIERGDKNFEVRRDDRGFQKGDHLILRWYDPKRNATLQGVESLRYLERTITYILTGGQFGLEPGHVVLGLKPIGAADSPFEILLGTAVAALTHARRALDDHYVAWDGEPEDGQALAAARTECDAALSLLLPHVNVASPE